MEGGFVSLNLFIFPRSQTRPSCSFQESPKSIPITTAHGFDVVPIPFCQAVAALESVSHALNRGFGWPWKGPFIKGYLGIALQFTHFLLHSSSSPNQGLSGISDTWEVQTCLEEIWDVQWKCSSWQSGAEVVIGSGTLKGLAKHPTVKPSWRLSAGRQH